jgi:hypothetical protein
MSNREMIREYDQVTADSLTVDPTEYEGLGFESPQEGILDQIETARWWLSRASGIVAESKRKKSGLSDEDLELLAICQNNLALSNFYMRHTE